MPSCNRSRTKSCSLLTPLGYRSNRTSNTQLSCQRKTLGNLGLGSESLPTYSFTEGRCIRDPVCLELSKLPILLIRLDRHSLGTRSKLHAGRGVQALKQSLPF